MSNGVVQTCMSNMKISYRYKKHIIERDLGKTQPHPTFQGWSCKSALAAAAHCLATGDRGSSEQECLLPRASRGPLERDPESLSNAERPDSWKVELRVAEVTLTMLYLSLIHI